MNITTLAQRAGQWALRRASETSTYTGLALFAVNVGWPQLAAHITQLGNVAPMVLASLGAGLMTASTTPHPLALPAPADPQPAAPAAHTAEEPDAVLLLEHHQIIQETDMTTILAVLEADVVTFLKAAGKEVETFFLTETQKLVAQAKATYLGTLGLNLIQTLESQTLSDEAKMATVVAMIAPAIQKFVDNGGLPGLVTSVEDFALEFCQSLYNDFKADLAKVVAPAAAAQAA
jgi:hypothetical protein